MLNYVVVCDRCFTPHGSGNALWINAESARAAADSDPSWRTLDGEDVCPECSIKRANEEAETVTDWREWLGEVEHELRLSNTDDPLVDALIEGYRLMAEALEARAAYLELADSPYPTRSEGEMLQREYDEEQLAVKMHEACDAALAHLRGGAE